MSQRLASRRSRLGGALIDTFALLVGLTPGGIAVLRAADTYGNDGMGAALCLLVMGVLGVLGVQFYLLVEKGQTIGKKTMGIRIVDYNAGTLVGAGRVAGVRGAIPFLVALIPYVGWLLALGDVLFLFGKERRCVHDRLAGTKVVTEAPSRAASNRKRASSGNRQTSSGGRQTSSTGGETPTNGAAPPSVRNSPRRSPSGPPASSPSAKRPSVPVPPRPGSRSNRSDRTKVRSRVLPKLTAARDMKVTMKELNRLRENGRLTDHEHRQRRQQVLATIVTETDAGPNEVLRGVLRLQGNGLLDVEDVRIVTEILNVLYPDFSWEA